MEEFIGNVRMVLGVLGYPILEPILQTTEPKKQEGRPVDEIEVINPINELTFAVNNLTAKGAATDEGFVLKKGSQLSKYNMDSIPGSIVKIKDRLLKDGVLKESDNSLVATEDILLSSSSYAAAIVAGTSRSGPQSWRAANGKTMKQIEDELLGK
jgi:hypothetical protein